MKRWVGEGEGNNVTAPPISNRKTSDYSVLWRSNATVVLRVSMRDCFNILGFFIRCLKCCLEIVNDASGWVRSTSYSTTTLDYKLGPCLFLLIISFTRYKYLHFLSHIKPSPRTKQGLNICFLNDLMNSNFMD